MSECYFICRDEYRQAVADRAREATTDVAAEAAHEGLVWMLQVCLFDSFAAIEATWYLGYKKERSCGDS